VLTIPGNHDERAFTAETFYGNEFYALTDRPCTIHDHQDWRIVAVPYGDGGFSPLVETLRSATAPDKTNVLMLHCTWSLPHYTGQDYGGDDFRYLPITEEILTGLGYNYILAGHFHTTYRQRKLPCGAIFVYPGSPVSVTSKEQGRRSVNIVDEQGCRQHLLDTWYCHTLDYYFRPTDNTAVLEELAREISPHPDDLCDLTLKLTGYIRERETEFHQRVSQLIAGRANTTVEQLYRSAENIFTDPLYQRIKLLVEKEQDTEQKDLLETMMLDAFSQLLAEGK
jgi:DNA repair exonuclease SbcCD nuclease subunit